MQLEKRISLISDQELIGEKVVECVDWVKAKNFGIDMVANFEIVLAEALNNIVEHAYLYRDDGVIDIELALDASDILIGLKDKGTKFPGIPQKKEIHRSEIRLEDLPEGGFGWFLIHSLTESISYQFKDGQNVLSLRMSED